MTRENDMIKYLKTFGLLIGLYFLLMILAYAIPNQWMEDNIRSGVDYIENTEGRWVNHYYMSVGATTDGWTDLSEMDRALDDEYDSIIKRAMSNGEYPRYWHGNHVLIRLLFVFFTYIQIRYLSQFLVIGSISIVFSLIWKRTNVGIALSFLISVILAYPFTMSLSLQYIIPFMAMMSGMIFILLKYREEMNTGIYFFVMGSVINFLDLLTFPLISLMMPLVLVMTWRLESKGSFENFLFAVKSSIQWAIGYGLTWIVKWVLATVILRKNVLKNALEQVLFRSSSDIGEHISRVGTVKKVFGVYFMFSPWLTRFCVMILGIIVLFYSVKYYTRVIAVLKKIWVFMPIAIIPCFWVFVLANHSYIHYGFVYRIFMGTAFALGCFGFEYIRRLRESS